MGLELGRGTPPHPNAVAIDLARHAITYVSLARGYRRMFVPRFTCDVLKGPLQQSGMEVFFYGIDASMDPLFDPAHLDDGEVLLYTNYFGLKDETIRSLASKGCPLLIDNAHSFYATPAEGIDTFYSCRKFFGVPDGAYLYTDMRLGDALERDVSVNRCEHLVQSAEFGTEAGYSAFQANEAALDKIPLRAMSHLTERMMAAIDHVSVSLKRRENCQRLHATLKDHNLLPIDPLAASVPMVYPFLTEDDTLRERLRVHGVYTARYWPALLAPVDPGTPEARFAERIVPLPIDQRYGPAHMDRILELVLA